MANLSNDFPSPHTCTGVKSLTHTTDLVYQCHEKYYFILQAVINGGPIKAKDRLTL